MTTALDVITRSLRMLGVYGIDAPLSADEAKDGLSILNALMGALSNTPLVFAKSLDTITLAGGVASITVGPSGTPATARPIKILDESYLTNGSVSYPLRIMTQQEYNDIPVKATQSIPEAIVPLMNMPDVTLTFWPVPIGGLTLNLWSTKQLSSFPSLTTAVSLPPGYEHALPLMLAEVLAPEYQKEPSPTLIRLIRQARRDIEVTNLQVPMLKAAPGMGGGHFHILTNS